MAGRGQYIASVIPALLPLCPTIAEHLHIEAGIGLYFTAGWLAVIGLSFHLIGSGAGSLAPAFYFYYRSSIHLVNTSLRIC